MSSADTRTRAIEALDRACSLPPAAGMDGEQVGGGRVLLTYEEAVDALLVAGWRPPADDAAVERGLLHDPTCEARIERAARDLLMDALGAIYDLGGCDGTCGTTGQCVAKRIRAYLADDQEEKP